MTNDDEAEGQGGPNFQVVVRVEWVDDHADVPVIYANQVQVSHGGPEFFLVFGTLVPPLSNAPDQIPDVLPIYPQVRIVISREAMPGIVQALNDNLRRYSEAQRGGG